MSDKTKEDKTKTNDALFDAIVRQNQQIIDIQSQIITMMQSMVTERTARINRESTPDYPEVYSRKQLRRSFL